MIVKSIISNNNTIYVLDNSELFNSITSTKHLRGCKSNYINKNKDNNKSFHLVTLTKYPCNCRNKYIRKDSKDSDLGS